MSTTICLPKWGTSNEYYMLMFSCRNKKYIYLDTLKLLIRCCFFFKQTKYWYFSYFYINIYVMDTYLNCLPKGVLLMSTHNIDFFLGKYKKTFTWYPITVRIHSHHLCSLTRASVQRISTASNNSATGQQRLTRLHLQCMCRLMWAFSVHISFKNNFYRTNQLLNEYLNQNVQSGIKK